MPEMTFAQAIDFALGMAMERDERVITFGEDVTMLRRELFVRFGPKRVRQAPISEAAFLAAGVGAAMAGLRPVVEIMMVDFIAVAFDALLNQATKIRAFSGGKWNVPLVVRASCGGGYGDAGQHEQCLWGLLSGMPGIAVVVPSNPADAAGLMLSAIESEDPVVFLEHKLLSDYWLDYLGAGGRSTVCFDVPAAGARGEVPSPPLPVPIGKARKARDGGDISILSLGVSLHRCLEAADILEDNGIKAEVVDLRSACPLDRELILSSAARSGRVLVVDEDYLGYGLSGEVAAVLSEAGIKADFARVGPREVIPYARRLEDEVLPDVRRIREAALRLCGHDA
ncbi:transketolase C-terminal domain-containing protein [Candidatus Solincola tengchongensis]|uniref:alpha-ketoacid dehydrogenase subunit beta n=1 Tax=Candidatus Solincola tengchongensis TaxID=2900693 RepID=UPI00257C2E7C|nr:transketolase C-terminal domain-containing protein [Candidatus Solincola tengchongensis]